MPAPGQGDGGGGLVDHAKSLSLTQSLPSSLGLSRLFKSTWASGIERKTDSGAITPARSAGKYPQPWPFSCLGSGRKGEMRHGRATQHQPDPGHPGTDGEKPARLRGRPGGFLGQSPGSGDGRGGMASRDYERPGRGRTRGRWRDPAVL